MIIERDLTETFRIPILYIPSVVHVRQCDSTQTYIALYTQQNPRGRQYSLARYAAIKIDESVEYAEIVNPLGTSGRMVVEILTRAEAIPTHTTAPPAAGKVIGGSISVGTTPIKLPAYIVVEGRDVAIECPNTNTANVLVNGFAVEPGGIVQLQVARLDDIEVQAESGVQTVKYLAEVRL